MDWEDHSDYGTSLKPYPTLAKARGIIADKRHEFEWLETPESNWQAAEHFVYSHVPPPETPQDRAW
jgi:hypothetical protein